MTSESAGGAVPELPPIEQATVFAWILAETVPVLVLLPRMRSLHIAPDGALAAADPWTTAVVAGGAQPMLDLDFAAAPDPRWQVTLTDSVTGVRIDGPGRLGGLYEGGLVCDIRWRQLVEHDHQDGRGLVVVTGRAAPTPQGALEMMEAEQAVWVRAHTTIT